VKQDSSMDVATSAAGVVAPMPLPCRSFHPPPRRSHRRIRTYGDAFAARAQSV
jgi:hypothetical protein